MSAPAALAVDGLSQSFGGLQVLRDLSFSVRSGEATALIGPNGAGKTTVFNVVSGVYPPTAGRLRLRGQDITHMPSRQRVRHGIARSFQNVRLMAHLTVLENLIVGQHAATSGLADLLVPFRLFPNHRWRREAAGALEEVGLGQYRDHAVGSLPYGIRKRIDLVRATLGGASLLMLDEPAAGLNPSETNALREHLALLRRRGVTLLVVEHDMHFVGQVCSRVVVLNFGEKIAEGTLGEVQCDEQVRAAYLGTKAAA